VSWAKYHIVNQQLAIGFFVTTEGGGGFNARAVPAEKTVPLVICEDDWASNATKQQSSEQKKHQKSVEWAARDMLSIWLIGSQKCNNKPLIRLNCNGINIKIIMY
jgi:hypothetical protein